jgi:CRISPR/Cas system CSM-associated protein Csm4 (group 5 of RAMP superfamily)
MPPALVVRFSPQGPWRIGPDSGERDRVEAVLHSDALYSAVTASMGRLGLLEEWLRATFEDPQGPPVRFSSCYPYHGHVRFIVPPLCLWPPAPSLKIRWKGARLVPVEVVGHLLADRVLDEDSWGVDGLSRCLVPADSSCGPFRPAVRSHAAVDRLSGSPAAYKTACLEFRPDAGMWALAAFSSEESKDRWSGPVRACLRLLADSGLGGERASGWGRSNQPEFEEGSLRSLVLGSEQAGDSDSESPPQPATELAYWLLSLFSPAPADTVDWGRGQYSLLTRAGRVESPSGRGGLKRLSRMVAEGSVIFSGSPPSGGAQDVAPEGVPHPVYRAGFALAVEIAIRGAAK